MNTNEYLFDKSYEDQYSYIRDVLKLKVSKEDIKQLEFDHIDNAYILLQDGSLIYNTDVILNNISYLWDEDISNIFGVSNDNVIYSLSRKGKVAKYMNSNDYKYKKIVSSPLFMLALTEDGIVKLMGGYYPNSCYNPINFIDVEDIDINIREDGFDYPVVKKNGEWLSLFIEDENR